MDDAFKNRVGGDRIASRQIDELVGIARGVAADGRINQAEAEFLQKWLAANADVSAQPLFQTLYRRIGEMLVDGVLDDDEQAELLDTLNRFADRSFELGEALKATTLPLCDPAPVLSFDGKAYCFTGTFVFGKRKDCEAAVKDRGATAGSLTRSTSVLVIGAYATESWKHSAFGNKILKAVDMRTAGLPISIVSEQHWTQHLTV
ncbi:BRCT domain-containing protein [Jiella marina]|uniref:BRCT domain-containing protein n=1 Tax=Jiella sp. LLJ827 TaxID=2917712 RepID=UPI00210112F3|nr:BRCT domain-containing protein [Jiella sp. LLJ827]MCQ0986416.1 BRCT domain-containing protein [Jiella sp. LLJ827]